MHHISRGSVANVQKSVHADGARVHVIQEHLTRALVAALFRSRPGTVTTVSQEAIQ